ncbi:glycoside hydrolase family 2 protein [Maribellus comscasis]|nr:sugar-binding domain-containing protein [Maribellus comscasis]
MCHKPQEYVPIKENILTEWAEQVKPENAWQEYPRPQLEREEWKNLNGLWNYAITPKSQEEKPEKWEGKILVPFSIETQLSGVGRIISEEEVIWYYRSFKLPKKWKENAILLHFEASDFETTVWLNGKLVGKHRGGYDSFEFDISDFVEGVGEYDLLVKVHDPQASIFKSLGKQTGAVRDYERCSGIWQTVWIEPVSTDVSIASVKINTSLEDVSFQASYRGNPNGIEVKYEVFDGSSLISSIISDANKKVKLKIPSPKLWSPESSFLYNLKISLLEDNKIIDEVDSYFGLRTLSISDDSSVKDILLNGKPIFQMGPLDQNYWPGGGLTLPSDEAMIWESEYLKRIGCNMVRLHIKYNPSRFYYHCDRLGLLVWQDFVSAQGRNNNPELEDSEFWFNEQKQMVEKLYNHPSIAMWIIFNEAWGQHDSEKIFERVEKFDNTRLINIASGWVDFPEIGDIKDIHDYTYRPAIPVPGTHNRAVVLGEVGGFASAVPPHNWTGRSNKTGVPSNLIAGGGSPQIPRDDNFKHDIFRPTFTYGENFEKQYSKFIDQLHLLQNSGLRGAVYTQMTDMKLEENGWLTFDRKVSKVAPDKLGKRHNRLYTKPPKQKILLPASTEEPQTWEASEIAIPWKNKKDEELLDITILQDNIPDFENLSWKQANGPFGNTDYPEPGMVWDGKNQLIIKNSVEFEEIPENCSVRIYYIRSGGPRMTMIHSRIYINGKFFADETTRQINQEQRMAEVILPSEAIAALNKGTNELIVQFIPGLNFYSGNVIQGDEKILVDVSITEF